jgi:hypothetical protein
MVAISPRYVRYTSLVMGARLERRARDLEKTRASPWLGAVHRRVCGVENRTFGSIYVFQKYRTSMFKLQIIANRNSYTENDL